MKGLEGLVRREWEKLAVFGFQGSIARVTSNIAFYVGCGLNLLKRKLAYARAAGRCGHCADFLM